MKRSRFTEHQIIQILKSVESGRLVKEVCREAGISEATYFITPPFLTQYIFGEIS